MAEAGRMGISAIAIGWYKRADYARIREVMVDRDKLPTTFDKWQGMAEKAERQIKASGKLTVRAHIDPDEFVAWCAARGLDVDADARNLYGNEVARDAVLESQKR